MRWLLPISLCAACAADEPPKIGYVTLYSESYVDGGTPTRRGHAGALFELPVGRCTTRVIDDACTLVTCILQERGTRVKAGTITVTGAALPITLVPGSPAAGEADGYTGVSSPEPLFVGDEALAIDGSGDEVPPFALALIAPSQPTITSPPPLGTNAHITVDRRVPFHAEWTAPTAAGDVDIRIGAHDSELHCRYPVADQRADIPVSALAALPVTSRQIGSVSASSISDSTTDAGDWHVVASASFNAVWPDGARSLEAIFD